MKFRPISPSKDAGRVKFAHILLPCIGALKVRLHRAIDWESAKTVTVRHTVVGDWYVSVAVEIPLKPVLVR